MAETIVCPELSTLAEISNPIPGPLLGTRSSDREIRAQVHELLAQLLHPVMAINRRADARYAYPYLVRMIPLNKQGATTNKPGIVVVGKTLSEQGFGFYHQQPLTERRMIATFHAGGDRWLRLLMDLRWCRFSGQGWYESGGRFLQAVPATPPESVPTPLGRIDKKIDTAIDDV